MNYWWANSKSERLWIYNETEFSKRLWLSYPKFKKLMNLEVERFSKILKQQWKDYYEAKISENPLILKYGNTPIFPNHPNKHSACVFNDKSWVYLEKMWSSKNKYNEWKDMPYDFIFDNT